MVVAWLLFPLLLLAVCLGCGLFVEWLAGWRLPAVLLPPVGLALVIVASTLTTSIAATTPVTTPLIVVVAVAGYAARWRRLRRIAPDWWAVAVGLGVFIVCAAPVVTSGNATWLGYFVDSDPSFHFILADWILHHGRQLSHVPPLPSSDAAVNALHSYLGTAYPTGADVALGALRPLVGQDLAWIYQPYLAVAMALGALALHELLRGVVKVEPLRAASAFIAAQPGLAYALYLEGSIKEIIASLLITVIIVLVVQALRHPLRLRGLAPLAVVGVAGLDVYALAIIPWIGIPVATLAVVAAWHERRRLRARPSRRAIAVPAAGLLVLGLAAPVLSGASTFITVSNAVLRTGDTLGNLAAPLSNWQILGIWPNGDFRFPDIGYTNAYMLIGVALAGAILGLAWMVRRRVVAPLLLVLSSGVATLYLLRNATPYAAAKVLMLFSIAAVLSAMLGAAALFDVRRRIEGTLLAVLVALGVLWTNVAAFHDSSVAPRARFQELAAIGTRFAGQGPAFYNLWDTFAAYFLRQEAATAPDTFAGPVPGAERHSFGQPSGPWDPNQVNFGFLETHRLLVLARSPVGSRPPANYRLVYRGRYYDVWQRTATPRVIRHIPLSSGGFDPTPVASCRTITETAALAARNHARLAYVKRPALPMLIPSQAIHPSSWSPTTAGVTTAPTYLTLGQNAGGLIGKIRVPAPGRYQVWLAGSFPRRIRVSVDRRFVGSVNHEISVAGQVLHVGNIDLAPGEQIVEIEMPASTFRPGSTVGGPFLGPLLLVRGDTVPPMSEIEPSQARSLCGQRLDWIEIVT